MANKYPETLLDKKNEWTGELKAHYCPDCIYIFVGCSVDRSSFFEDYYYLSSVNQELKAHFKSLAKSIARSSPALVVDVGSNDGILLEQLAQLACKAVGVDPAKNVAAVANERGLQTEVGFFDESIVSKIIDSYGYADVVVASSVLTHLDDPVGFFNNARALLGKKGRVIIEIEYLGDIISTNSFERFYFDRPHYYSITCIEILAAKAGFFLDSAEFINTHGGSVRLTFGRDVVGTLTGTQAEGEFLSGERVSASFAEFSKSCLYLREYLESARKSRKNIVGYGCPARFATITNFADIDPSLLPVVIDDSPLKLGRFSPGKHIPIVSLDDAGIVDAYIVFAYEYIDSIREKITNTGIKSRYFRPLPFSEI